MTLRIGSLATGYGGLDMAVQVVGRMTLPAPLHPGDLRAAAAVVEVQASTHPFMAPLAARLLDAANNEPATQPDHEEDADDDR